MAETLTALDYRRTFGSPLDLTSDSYSNLVVDGFKLRPSESNAAAAVLIWFAQGCPALDGLDPIAFESGLREYGQQTSERINYGR